MSGARVETEVANHIASIRKAAAELAAEDLGQLIGADFAKANQLTEVVELTVHPALLECRAFADLPDDRLRMAPLPLLAKALSALQRLQSVVSTLKGYASGRFDTSQIANQQQQARNFAQTNVPVALEELELLQGRLFSQDRGPTAQKLNELSQLESKLTKLAGEIDAIHAKAAEALATVERAAAQDGVRRQGKAFSSAVERHQRAAKDWVRFGLGLALLILALVTVSAVYGQGPPLPKEPWTAAANLAHFSARALAVSILSFLMVVAFRNYRAARHNEVVNAHRASALSTYPEFNAAAHGAIQEVILLQATEAVFGPQSTGYSDVGSDGSTTHVGELLRLIRNDTGKS